MKIITSNGKKKIKISKNEWEAIGQKQKWMKISEEEAQETIIQTSDRIENIRNIANYMIENCPRDNKLMNTLWGYGQQLLISADELEKKLEQTKFRSIENPEGWE